MLACTLTGSPETLRTTLPRFIAETQADELIVTTNIYDHEKRKRSFELLAGVAGLTPKRPEVGSTPTSDSP